jgi:acyl carrier protein
MIEVKAHELERQVLEVVAKIAQAPVVAAHETLHELGIGSLAFIRLVIQLERTCGIAFVDQDIDAIRFTTVDDVVSYVVRRAGAGATRTLGEQNHGQRV